MVLNVLLYETVLSRTRSVEDPPVQGFPRHFFVGSPYARIKVPLAVSEKKVPSCKGFPNALHRLVRPNRTETSECALASKTDGMIKHADTHPVTFIYFLLLRHDDQNIPAALCNKTVVYFIMFYFEVLRSMYYTCTAPCYSPLLVVRVGVRAVCPLGA